MLLQVPRGQEGAGVETLPWELDDLLGFDPATVDELEALQVDNLRNRGQTHVILWTEASSHSLVLTPSHLNRLKLDHRSPADKVLKQK